MVESIVTFLAPYAPFAIFGAAILDIFFVTGLFLYGAAMLSSIVLMYTTGMITLELIVISSYCGTVLGNTMNYFVGLIFEKAPIVSRKLDHPNVKKVRTFLDSRGLFFYIFICRFIAITRPLYALVLGSMEIKFWRFITYELIVAFFWIIFWLLVLAYGGNLLSFVFNE